MRRKGRENWEGRWAVTRKREREGGRQRLRERQGDPGKGWGEKKREREDGSLIFLSESKKFSLKVCWKNCSYGVLIKLP